MQDHPETKDVAEDVAYVTEDPVAGIKTGVCYTYHNQRDRLNYLMDDMFTKGNAIDSGMFEDKREVFSTFCTSSHGRTDIGFSKSC